MKVLQQIGFSKASKKKVHAYNQGLNRKFETLPDSLDYNDYVYPEVAAAQRCINIVAGMVARTPLAIFDLDGNKINPTRNQRKLNVLRRKFSYCGKPDGETDSHSWKEIIITELLTSGNVWLFKRDGNLIPARLYKNVKKRLTGKVALLPLTTIDGEDPKSNVLVQPNRADVAHIKWTDLGKYRKKNSVIETTQDYQGYKLGLPPAHNLSNLFEASSLADKYVNDLLARGILSDIVIQLGENVDPDQSEAWAVGWVENGGVLQTDYRNKITTAGEGMKDRATGYNELKKRLDSQVCAAYGAFPFFAGIESGQVGVKPYELNNVMVTQTLAPIMNKIGCAISSLMFESNSEYMLGFDWEVLLMDADQGNDNPENNTQES